MEIANISFPKEKVMAVESSLKLREMFFGEKLKPQDQELMFRPLSSVTMETVTTIKPLESDYSY
jgi:hypothetical protein